MFAGVDSTDFVRTGTMTGIEGFPPEASNKSINHIVKELKQSNK
jgi:hypothetical protein